MRYAVLFSLFLSTYAVAGVLPVDINSQSREAAAQRVYQANKITFRVTFRDGTNRVSIAGKTPAMWWAPSVNASGVSTSSWAIVDTNGGVVDFTFSAASLNTNGSTFVYGAGFTDDPQTYRIGSFSILPDPSTGASVSGVVFSAGLNWDAITESGTRPYVPQPVTWPAGSVVVSDDGGLTTRATNVTTPTLEVVRQAGNTVSGTVYVADGELTFRDGTGMQMQLNGGATQIYPGSSNDTYLTTGGTPGTLAVESQIVDATNLVYGYLSSNYLVRVGHNGVIGSNVTVTVTPADRELVLSSTDGNPIKLISGGVLREYGTAITKLIPAGAGGWFWYIDNDGVSTISQTPWSLYGHAQLAYVYVTETDSATNYPWLLLEAHKAEWPDSLHARLHLADGAKITSGCGIIHNAGTGAAAADGSNSVITMLSGVLMDEDLAHRIAASGSASNNASVNTNTAATIPWVTLRSGSTFDVVYSNLFTVFPFFHNGASPIYQTGTNWAAIPEDRFWSTYVVTVPNEMATNYFIMQDQTNYSTAAQASNRSPQVFLADLQAAGYSIPFNEVDVAYQLILNHNAAAVGAHPASVKNTRIVGVVDYRGTTQVGLGSTGAGTVLAETPTAQQVFDAGNTVSNIVASNRLEILHGGGATNLPALAMVYNDGGTRYEHVIVPNETTPDANVRVQMPAGSGIMARLSDITGGGASIAYVDSENDLQNVMIQRSLFYSLLDSSLTGAKWNDAGFGIGQLTVFTNSTDGINTNLSSGTAWAKKGLMYIGATPGAAHRFTNTAMSVTLATPIDSSEGVTYSAWVWLDKVLSGIAQQVVTTPDRQNSLYFGTTLAPVFGNAAGNKIVTGTAIPTQQWVHVVGVWDRTNDLGLIYTNGILSKIGGLDKATSMKLSTTNLLFGYDTLGDAFRFGGAMDDVRIYQNAMTSNDVALIYNAGVIPSTFIVTNGLALAWEFQQSTVDEIAGATLTNSYGKATPSPQFTNVVGSIWGVDSAEYVMPLLSPGYAITRGWGSVWAKEVSAQSGINTDVRFELCNDAGVTWTPYIVNTNVVPSLTSEPLMYYGMPTNFTSVGSDGMLKIIVTNSAYIGLYGASEQFDY